MLSKNQPSLGLRLFIKLFKDELVSAAYHGILGRAPDEAGAIAHATALDGSGNLAETLRILSHSDELAVQLPYENILERRKSAHLAYLQSFPHVTTSTRKILVMGNCQAHTLARLIDAMLGGCKTTAIELLPEAMNRLKEGEEHLSQLMGESDLILVHPHGEALPIIKRNYPEAFKRTRMVPRITSSAFHPDIDYVEDSQGKHVLGPLGAYQSAIAFFGWQNALSIAETLNLFCEDVYDSLGYFAYPTVSRELLLKEGELTGLPLDRLIDRWSTRGCWMYSMNHPKLFPLADVARTILEQEGFETIPGVEEFVEDEMIFEGVWPIYPEVAKRMGLPGHYLFKRPTDPGLKRMPVQMLGLGQFVEESFATFSKYQKHELTCRRLTAKRYEALKSRLPDIGRARAVPGANADTVSGDTTALPRQQSPYAGLPDYQFWRRAIEQLPMVDVNPVSRVRFGLNRETRVATAGSCFAQHISRTLQKNGFGYYVTEGGKHLSHDEASKRQYGVFSARYGNLYTARQLLQLFDRAYGKFFPQDTNWVRADGRLVDPFRPQIEVDGFDDLASLERSRSDHFVFVREMFETLDVFVFTLGLTEAWRNKRDGAVFPLAPGVVADGMRDEDYEFVNFDVNDVIADMHAFIEKLHQINRHAKIILTVSPVPLIATFENQHVLVSNTYSKAVLRAAAGEIARRNPACDYFPSFEIITGNYNKGAYFEKDLRSITASGVEHVMRLFLSNYAGDAFADDAANVLEPSTDLEIEKELSHVNEIMCDEEAIDPLRKQ